jgi:hypothetical protein
MQWCVKFEVLIATTVHSVSRDVMPCSLVGTYTLNFSNLLLPTSTLKMDMEYCSSGQQVTLECW